MAPSARIVLKPVATVSDVPVSEDSPTSELEIGADSGGVRLAGTLWRPVGEAVAGVLMHPGSGPSDRDNDVLFPPIREHLLGAGIAVCSFDKRGVGGSAGKLAGRGVIGEQADDLIAALAVFESESRRDLPLGLFGHSQGGWVVVEAAATRRSVAFVITNSGPGVSPATTGALLAHQQADRRSGSRDTRDVRRCRGGDARASLWTREWGGSTPTAFRTASSRGWSSCSRTRRSGASAPRSSTTTLRRPCPGSRCRSLPSSGRPTRSPPPRRASSPCARQCARSSSRSRSSPTATTGSSTGSRRASSTATSTGSARSCGQPRIGGRAGTLFACRRVRGRGAAAHGDRAVRSAGRAGRGCG